MHSQGPDGQAVAWRDLRDNHRKLNEPLDKSYQAFVAEEVSTADVICGLAGREKGPNKTVNKSKINRNGPSLDPNWGSKWTQSAPDPLSFLG